MSSETYNGWTNRETWAVALHINNDQGWQESVHDAIRGEWLSGHISAGQSHKAGEIVRENVESFFSLEHCYAGDRIYSSDLVDAVMLAREDVGSMWRVDWSEIGAAFLADVTEQDA